MAEIQDKREYCGIHPIQEQNGAEIMLGEIFFFSCKEIATKGIIILGTMLEGHT
jgi:hypothetical protein